MPTALALFYRAYPALTFTSTLQPEVNKSAGRGDPDLLFFRVQDGFRLGSFGAGGGLARRTAQHIFHADIFAGVFGGFGAAIGRCPC